MATNSHPHDWKEARRLRAFELKRAGWAQQAIAEALGVSKGAVSQWLTTAKSGGLEALYARPRPGSPAKLTAVQRDLIPEYLSHGAAAYGFRGNVWTCARVAKVIESEFGVVYHTAHVSRVLKELDWTPQRPIERATQRDEARIEQWRTDVWPALEKQARRERRTPVFIDESGFYLLPALVRTYAPCGETPVLRVFETYDHLSVMSGLTPAGQLFSLIRSESLTGTERVCFLQHVQRQLGTKLLVIWDGSPIHRSAKVKAFLSEGAARSIHLEPLPPYAPDLNPDEGVWQLLKTVEMRNLGCADFDHLHRELYLAIRRLRRKPHLLQTCFAGAGLEL